MKKLLLILLCLPLLFGCNPFDNSDELIKEGIKNQNNNSALAIGDTHQGGIII